MQYASPSVSLPMGTPLAAIANPRKDAPFLVVTTDNGTNIDFMDADSDIAPQHYAFLVSETEFDEIWNGRFPTGLIPRKRKRMRSIITTVGRGFYFEDPNGHFLEVITRPYGSGGYNP